MNRTVVVHIACIQCIKLFAFDLASKINEVRQKSRSTTFVQRVKRHSQTAQNGDFPSPANSTFERNQLYTISR
jgi:hypothetical protein